MTYVGAYVIASEARRARQSTTDGRGIYEMRDWGIRRPDPMDPDQDKRRGGSGEWAERSSPSRDRDAPDPSVHFARKIPGRPCVDGNPRRAAHPRKGRSYLTRPSYDYWQLVFDSFPSGESMPCTAERRLFLNHENSRPDRRSDCAWGIDPTCHKSWPQALRWCPALPKAFRARRASLGSSARGEPTGSVQTGRKSGRGRFAFPLNRLFSSMISAKANTDRGAIG
jgi:hypothetical protein